MDHPTPEHLQRLLREFGGPLADVKVHPRDSAAGLFQPHLANITGLVNIHGKAVMFEVEDFDLRRIKGVDDVLGLAGQLLESFQSADKAPQMKEMTK